MHKGILLLWPLLDLHWFPFGPGLDAFHWTCVGFIAFIFWTSVLIAPTSGPVWADSFLDLGGHNALHFWACVGFIAFTFWTSVLHCSHFWTCVG